ncbi:hypothetical protein GS484_26805 [Rhodococcus hoagii]|nr:hypothetical protein [Prescottella equi]
MAPVAGSTIAVDGWHFEEYILPTVSDTFLHGDSLTPIWITASHHSDHELYYANQVVMVYEAERKKNPPAGAHCGTAASSPTPPNLAYASRRSPSRAVSTPSTD